MSQNEPEGRRDEGGREAPAGHGKPDQCLEWSVFPFLENLSRSIVVVLVIIGVAVLVYLVFKDVFLVILSVAILFASLHTYFTRTRYRLDGSGVAVRTLSVKTAKPWSHFKRYYADDRGITLSPFAQPSRLEPFRSVRLLYGSNKDEVVAFVSKRVVGDA
ncbi:MAG: hypothetical protein PVH52_01395 [bacterium]|jgi:hypothetical protein